MATKRRSNTDDHDRRRQARAAQLEAAARIKRRRTLTQVAIIGGVAVVVIAIVATAVVLGTRDRGVTAAPTVDTMVDVQGAQVPLAVDGTAVRVGPADAKATIDLWVDYSCPHCQEFEAANASVLNGLVAKGDVAVKYHNIRIVTDYGTEAGSASACVAANDSSLWVAFNSALYANHSADTDGWTASDFRDFASQQGAGSTTQDCIASETYRDWIAANTEASTKAGVTGTPTMFLNGQKTDTLTGQALVDKVDGLVAA